MSQGLYPKNPHPQRCDNNCECNCDPIKEDYAHAPENTCIFCQLPDEGMGMWVSPVTTARRGCASYKKEGGA